MSWLRRFVDDYHLPESDLKKLLKEKFGNYDFDVKRGQDVWTFLAPRDLNEDELAKLDEKRWASN